MHHERLVRMHPKLLNCFEILTGDQGKNSIHGRFTIEANFKQKKKKEIVTPLLFVNDT